MTKLDQRNLTEAVRGCITELRAREYYTIPEIAELVMERHPDAVAEAANRLARETISNIARKMIKQGQPLNAYQRPLFLPDEVANIGLTDGFSLPPPGVEPEGPEEDNAHAWVSLYRASLVDVRLHIALLLAGRGHIQRRLDAFQQLEQFLTPIMTNGREFEPIGPVLEEIAAKQRAGKAA